MLYIDPVRCIDCDACALACPVDAIFREQDLPAKWNAYVAVNRDYFLKPESDESASGS
jgi:ferredoxin--NADP+ reductase